MNCRLCFGSDLKQIKTENIYYYCNRCGLIFLDDKEVLSVKEEIKRYQMHENTHENKGYVSMFESFIENTITPYQKEIKTVLDFGCGPGPVLADLLLKEGYTVDIYDPYFYPEESFKNKTYDLITSTEVFEHLLDPNKELRLLVDHLNEGGYLAIMTSFHPGKEKFVDWFYIWDETHITFYNINTFKWIADKYSLNLVYYNNIKYCLFKKK